MNFCRSIRGYHIGLLLVMVTLIVIFKTSVLQKKEYIRAGPQGVRDLRPDVPDIDLHVVYASTRVSILYK